MNTTSDIVHFGKRYSYEHDARTIVDNGPPNRRIPLSSFTTPQVTPKQGLRRVFSDADLALAIFKDELDHATFEIVQDLKPRWVGVQVVVPMIEMIGKILDAAGGDGDNFRAGATRVVPKADVVAVHGWVTSPSRDQYKEILNTLWVALRCGTCHAGFMQDEEYKHIDVQVRDEDDEPALKFSDDLADPGYMVVEVGGRAFIDAVVREVKSLIEELEQNVALKQGRFLERWQRRWGSYPL